MHLTVRETRSLDETETAEDLGQSPADIVVLSFSDSDLSALAAAHSRRSDAPSLRLASLARLRHPYSVDLYLDAVARHARAIVVRCLGGADYWRYGLDELAVLARARGIPLAVVPGDHLPDLRLDRAATMAEPDLRRIWGWFQEGGPDNMAALLDFLAATARGDRPVAADPVAVPPAGRFEAGCRAFEGAAGRALVVFYRSHLLAADTAPIVALADALAHENLAVTALHATSLKDPRAAAAISATIAAERPDVIVNTTAFSGRRDGPEGGTVLDEAGVPVLQAMLPITAREAWDGSARGLGAADLAMNVVLPELDGRIVTRAISFKRPGPVDPALEFAPLRHEPEPESIAAVAALAAGWVRLAKTPRATRRIAMVLSDYPAKGGRTGYAVGLDTPASVRAIAQDLDAAGYPVGPVDAIADLVAGRTPPSASLGLDDYAALFALLPASFRATVEEAWGPAGEDPDVEGGAFRFRVLEAGNLAVAVQPDRGRRIARKDDYHDPNRPPRHGYVAFHLWLRHRFRLDALVHLGTHGTLEWLPGKAVAPGGTCAPALLVGPVPVVYPFIVNNPGEAAPAKRRIAAVTVGHMTPPLTAAGHHGAAAEVEALLDEYAEAAGLDPRRARRIGEAALARARETGLARESGVADGMAPDEALARLDAWLCDLKDLRIGDGLHVFGRVPEGAQRAATATALAEAGRLAPEAVDALIAESATGEAAGLVAALDGRFVPPGPAGAPARGRLDVLPTGRNLTAVDPRAIPTATAETLGRDLAAAVMDRHAQDYGEWPRRIVVDLWGSATMRTGGEDFAQALALLGVAPRRDPGSARVAGFEILAQSRLERPRVDVTLRVSGLFRDVFSAQMALFDQAVRAVAALDEDDDTNPLAAARRAGAAALRIFSAAPGAYGTGVGARLDAEAFEGRADLGEAYIAASAFAYGAGAEGAAAEAEFRDLIARADAFLHVQDNGHQDLLDSDAVATHAGGFAAAAAALGARPAMYHADTTVPGRTRVRPLAEAVALVLRGRAANPRWLAGQMRHGHRGAAEIAETVGNLYAFAATTDAVASEQFDLLYDATLGDEAVRGFMLAENPQAARATARKFTEAHRRGFWQTRRNAPLALLAELTGDAA